MKDFVLYFVAHFGDSDNTVILLLDRFYLVLDHIYLVLDHENVPGELGQKGQSVGLHAANFNLT